MPADIGSLATVVFGTTAYETSWAGQLRSVKWSGMNREVIDISSMSSGAAKTFLGATKVDPGEISIEGLYDLTSITTGDDAYTDMAANSIESITLSLPDGSGGFDTLVCPGIFTSYDVDAAMDTEMTFSATFKLSGPPVITGSA